MKPGIHHMVCLLVVGTLPIGISPPTDLSETNISISGGAGQYAHITRGCDGSVLSKKRIPTREYSVSFDRIDKSGLRFGIIGSSLRSREEESSSATHEDLGFLEVNPYVGIEWKGAAFCIGLVAMPDGLPGMRRSRTIPSGYLRIGNRRSFYVDLRFMQTPSALTASYVQLGLGADPDSGMGTWFGVGAAPHDKIGFLARFDLHMSRQVHLDLTARLGGSEGVSESGISVGVRYRR